MADWKVDRKLAVGWIKKALLANTQYHQTRNRVFEDLTKRIKESKGSNDPVVLSLTRYNILKGFLTSRNAKVEANDSMKLSYDKTMQEWFEEISTEEVADEDDEGEDEADASNSDSPAPTVTIKGGKVQRTKSSSEHKDLAKDDQS
jgi:hypothetical protein